MSLSTSGTQLFFIFFLPFLRLSIYPDRSRRTFLYLLIFPPSHHVVVPDANIFKCISDHKCFNYIDFLSDKIEQRAIQIFFPSKFCTISDEEDNPQDYVDIDYSEKNQDSSSDLENTTRESATKESTLWYYGVIPIVVGAVAYYVMIFKDRK